MQLVYKGSVKDLYQDGERLIFDYSDRYSIFDAVAQTLRNYFPGAHIEVCGDRGNGEEDARRAAEAVGGKLRIPSFSSVLIQKFKAITGGNQPTDWNDLFIAAEEL
jgi:phage/plasmid primase-like uncharacterized protein